MTVSITKVYTRVDGLREGGKTRGSVRTVPLTRAALDAVPARIGLLWPGVHGGFINWHHFRRKIWAPALQAAGLEYRVPYSLRHTAISRWLAGGLDVLSTARFAGTSIKMISETYGHVQPDAFDRARAAMERFTATRN
jgi:integrase